MRAKHIFLPIAAAILLGSYAFYSSAQKAKFDPELWKAGFHDDISGDRARLLNPLMAHVLKVGMSIQDVDELMGLPDFQLGESPEPHLGSPSIIRAYNFNRRGYATEHLILEFSGNGRLTDFYIEGRAKPVLF